MKAFLNIHILTVHKGNSNNYFPEVILRLLFPETEKEIALQCSLKINVVKSFDT